MPAHTHKADAHFVAHKALHARSTCAIQNLRKNTDTQLQVPSKKVHGEPSSTKNMVCRAAVAHALLKGTLIISQIQAFARCLPEQISPLGTCTIPQLQVSSKMAHVEPSSSKNKLWTQTTTSAARKITVLGRKKGNSARSSGANHPSGNALKPTAPSLIKKGPRGAEQQQKQAVDAKDN